MTSYNDAYLSARSRLRAAGAPMPELEARLILSHITGLSHAELLRDFENTADAELTARADALTRRRESGEPLAYILGEWEFYGLPLVISPDVLIPRDDTETLAAAAIDAAKRSGGRVLDLCAGSGCVGLAIAANVPDCSVVLADLSPGALGICRANIQRNGLAERVTAVEADACLEPPSALGSFDVIACNPPYIPAGEIDTLDLSVRDFEPREALDGGADGLRFYRVVADKWRGALTPGGTLLFECGITQAGDVREIMETNGFTDIIILRDASGIERVVTGRIGG